MCMMTEIGQINLDKQWLDNGLDKRYLILTSLARILSRAMSDCGLREYSDLTTKQLSKIGYILLNILW